MGAGDAALVRGGDLKRAAYIALAAATLAGLHLAQPYAAGWPAVAVLLWGLLAQQGPLHGAFYNTHRFGGVHAQAEIHARIAYVLGWAAGLHAVLLLGIALSANVVFQAGINRSYGWPLVDPAEGSRYEVAGRDASFMRLFYGRRRWLELALGLLLTAAGLYLQR